MEIVCNNETEVTLILKELDKMKAFWATTGDTASAWSPSQTYPVYFIVNDDKTLAWDDHHHTGETLIQATDYLYELSMEAAVNHPTHYTGDKVECIEAMETMFGAEAVKNFAALNCFKYLWRRRHKNKEEQDIQKALWYFDKMKELMNR